MTPNARANATIVAKVAVERRVRRLVDKEMKVAPAKCCVCRKENKGTKTQWWHLRGYYGLNGFVCNMCFKKVAHRNGKPNHPAAYRNVLKKLPYSNVAEGKPELTGLLVGPIRSEKD